LSWSIFGSARDWSRLARLPPARQRCDEIVAILLPPSKRG